jgi:hypothetical protein
MHLTNFGQRGPTRACSRLVILRRQLPTLASAWRLIRRAVQPDFWRIDMIYLIGGAPRAGKSILGQSTSAKLNIGWISTDLLVDLLRLKNDDGVEAG